MEQSMVQVLIDSAPLGICITNAQGIVTALNQRYAALYGQQPEDLTGKHCTVFAEPQFATVLTTGIVESPQELRLEAVDGVERTVLAYMRGLLGSDNGIGFQIFLIDITDRKQAEQRAARAQHFDALTGLPNRLLFTDRVAQGIREAGRDRTKLSLLLLDLNRFKVVNDTLGLSYGDQLLHEVGKRMLENLRGSDTVARFAGEEPVAGESMARLGGDEFAILLPRTGENGAQTVAHTLADMFTTPIRIDGQQVEVSASIGIAIYPDHGTDAPSLLRQAEVAMYQAKSSGSGPYLYTATRDRRSATRVTLIGDLRYAILNNQLTLNYQPVVDRAINRTRHVEALVRWRHPQHGILPPDRFIPIAEETGLILRLTLWVLEEALAQCRRWEDAGLILGVGVNLSMRTLYEPQFSDLISALLRQYRLAPQRLTLEITESVLMAQPEQVMAVLQRTAETGVRIAIDDFGIGYSSLSYLRRLPVHVLKLDRSLVADAANDARAAAIVVSMAQLGHSLDLRIVAEGIETEELWEALTDLCCDAGQGYYLGRPLPPAAIVQQLSGDSRTR